MYRFSGINLVACGYKCAFQVICGIKVHSGFECVILWINLRLSMHFRTVQHDATLSWVFETEIQGLLHI